MANLTISIANKFGHSPLTTKLENLSQRCTLLDGEVTKVQVLSLYQRLKHWFAIINSAPQLILSISKICRDSQNGFSFGNGITDRRASGRDDETDVDNKDEAEGGSDDESDAGEEADEDTVRATHKPKKKGFFGKLL